MWRAGRLQDLKTRIESLALGAHPEVSALAAKMQEHTAALDALWESQQQPGYERRWWQDGEYDRGRADQ